MNSPNSAGTACSCGDGDCDTCFPKPPGYMAEWQRREWKRELENLADEMESLTCRMIGDDPILEGISCRAVELAVDVLREVAEKKFGKTT